MLIGEILTDLFGIKQENLEKALELQKELGGYIGQILISMGTITETQLLQSLSRQLNIPLFEKDGFEGTDESIITTLSKKINLDYLIKNRFLPVDFNNDKLTLLTNDPLKNSIIDYILKSLSCRINLFLASDQTIDELSRSVIKETGREVISFSINDDPDTLKEMAAEAPVIKFLNNLLSNAVELKASDLHLEPSGTSNIVRFRIDGVLHGIDTIDEKLYLAVVSRVKLLAGLDIAEKRLPQDGKFSTKIAATLIDVRVSSIPFALGEGVVMRLLYRERLTFDITRLGIEQDIAETILELINMPYGIILVTGPTGSGKTTTLYSMLSCLDSREKKIITVEDPVEYQLDGIDQIQVKSDIGLNFAASLRSILRHDPDVIMVGEIRDPETAEMAVQSALTGHLVLSTLHTNDAASSLFRLIEMGLEDYLLNASVLGIAAQRVVRRVCEACAMPSELSDEMMKKYKIMELFDKYAALVGPGLKFRKGAGCRKCANTGYKGMMAVFELFKYTDDLKEIFLKGHSIEALKKQLIGKWGFRVLRDDGLIKVMKGVTTIEEVLRVS